jgi:hypothetical protein
MGGRGSSFTKRQKERSRQEKQREKAERRLQRKAEKQPGMPEIDHGTSHLDQFEQAAGFATGPDESESHPQQGDDGKL